MRSYTVLLERRGVIRRRLSASGTVFDREMKMRQRAFALQREDSKEYEYLREAVASRVVERLRDVAAGRPLKKILDIGCNTGHIQRALVAEGLTADLLEESDGQIQFSQCEACAQVLEAGRERNMNLNTHFESVDWFVAEETQLNESIEAQSFDLVTSSLALHWVNELPLALLNARYALKPDGFFVAALLGGATLHELQYSFAAAEEERAGGISPHASPAARLSDMGGLMQLAGFNLITIDLDRIVVNYTDAFVLMDDLQRMAEQRAPGRGTNRNTSRDTFLATAAAYQHLFGIRDDPSALPSEIPATFEIIFLMGWAPSESQPKPLERGSASAKISDVLPSSSSAPDL